MKLLTTESCSNLPQVTSPQLFLRTGEPHPDGLFSYEIFGRSLSERSQNLAAIMFDYPLIHPIIWYLIKRVFRKQIKGIVQLRRYTISNGKIIFEDDIDEEDRKDYKFYIGLPALIDKLLELEIPDSISGNVLKKILDTVPDYRISCIIVLPPAYRQIIDEHNLDPLNQAYVNLLSYNQNLERMNKDPQDEKFGRTINLMQLTIETIYNYISEKLGKKHGAIRQFILGKRLDFTGRAVITVDPQIETGYLGIPVRMAVKLFEPWLLRSLTMEHGYSIDEAIDLIQRISSGYVKPGKPDYEKVKQVLENIVKDRVVLAKRDPALHRLSWQGFKVKLVDDNTIHVNPLVTTGYNADFDGDSIYSKTTIIVASNKFEVTAHISELEDIEVDIDEFGNVLEVVK